MNRNIRIAGLALCTPLLLALAACTPHPPPADEAQMSVPETSDAPRPPAEGEHPVPGLVRAHGNEPFWTLDVEGDTLRYARVGVGEPVLLQAEPVAHGNGLEFSGEEDGGPFRLNIEASACPNTMSDETHEFTVTFQFRGETLNGCADRVE